MTYEEIKIDVLYDYLGDSFFIISEKNGNTFFYYEYSSSDRCWYYSESHSKQFRAGMIWLDLVEKMPPKPKRQSMVKNLFKKGITYEV